MASPAENGDECGENWPRCNIRPSGALRTAETWKVEVEVEVVDVMVPVSLGCPPPWA